MRLFLSSENLGNYPHVFLKMVGNGNLAIVENAKDDWAEADRSAKVNEHLNQLNVQGIEAEEIDLRRFFDRSAELKEKLASFGGLFAFGGNTFILRRAMAQSGLDSILVDRVKSDSMAYGGSSAGSCIAAPSLKGLDTDDADDPHKIPEGYDREVIWEGLNLIDFYIVPHYETDWFGKEAYALENYYKANRLPHKVLKDGQVIVINGDQEEFLE